MMSKPREAQSIFCWLIENGKQAGQGLAYRRMEEGLPVWTEDANKALWFVRREDAEAFAEEDREAERIVEHGFHTPLKAEPEQEPVMIYHGRHTIDCGEFGSHDMEMLKLIPAGTKLYTSPQPREDATANALENIAAYLGIGGFNGATEEQLEERIKAEFDRLKPREWQELSPLEMLILMQEVDVFTAQHPEFNKGQREWAMYLKISAALRAKNELNKDKTNE